MATGDIAMTVMTQPSDIPFTFTPGLPVDDPYAEHWLRQVTVRLRREICWLWHEQGVAPSVRPDSLPTIRDKAPHALQLQRFWKKKQQFFQSDPTAKYLSEQLLLPLPPEPPMKARGSFGWVIKELDLNQVEAFLLALGLIIAFDNAAGSVIATCLNDPSKTKPTLTLAQRLWDHPEQVLRLADPEHPLFHYGLLQMTSMTYQENKLDWDKPLEVPWLVARQLLFPNTELGNDFLLWNKTESEDLTLRETARLIASRLNHHQGKQLQIVPIRGPQGAPYVDVVQSIESLRQKQIRQFFVDPHLLKQRAYLDSVATLCWLQDLDLFLDYDQLCILQGDRSALELEHLPKTSIPITLFLAIQERAQIAKLPNKYLLPLLEVPAFTYYDRVQEWKKCLGPQAADWEETIQECARRFRFQKKTIAHICQGLKGYPPPWKSSWLLQACRTEMEFDLGDLAQKVKPRFENEDIVLPPKPAAQFQEILKAMRSLTKVHYEWGTEKVWNEGGISVLFSGPPGTGKTMAAEILALRLALPMFRIDLSQVASKYIGETEKNLKRLFDLADITDTILFFDEADALFGKRSEVKDAHDRYANLEISYLLERMERFKGMAILASNRKKDLDEAFLRRLRYILDFPLPGEEERYKIWQQVIPPGVDGSQLDWEFLAKKFSLAGGHIRSIVFNACLQAASRGGRAPEHFKGQLSMEDVVLAVRREYEKLNRSVSLEQFGPYAKWIEKLENRHA